MKKFFARFINIICFISAIFVFIPFDITSWVFSKIGLSSFGNYLSSHPEQKILLIPLIALLISFIFLILSVLDRKKSLKEVTTKPVQNASYAPIYYIGISASLSGFLLSLFNYIDKNPSGFEFIQNDYLGFGKIIRMIPFLNDKMSYLTGVFYFFIILELLLLIAIFNKAFKRGGFVKFINWMLLIILTFLSLKGFTDYYNNLGSGVSLFKNIFSSNTDLSIIETTKNIYKYIYLIIAALAFILYIIISPIVMKKNKKREEELYKKAPEKVVPLAPYKSPFENRERIDDPNYELPRTEDVLETQIEEKAVIKQVLFEQSNLDQIFDTSFEFKNCSMVKGDAHTDYYVNKVKFLTLSNHNRTLSFRLELDKAIRLIIQYPLIGKDKYEDHKIWFRIDDASVLSKDVQIGIIKDAYTTALNNY
ncbi:hypothetical protein J6Y73_02085 [bacterium]|nr:hypothetical protein [bacterium]